ncbi:unnamed protein product, partial [Tetraodon nigroviridis]
VVIAIIITALYSIVCVVGLVGNVLVMYIIVRRTLKSEGGGHLHRRYTKMKTATNIYIFNLALADALVTSTLPFQSVNYLMGTWPFGDVLCKIVMSIDYYNMFTSIFTLTTHERGPLRGRVPSGQSAGLQDAAQRQDSQRPATGFCPPPSDFQSCSWPPPPPSEKDRNLRRITRMVLVVVAVFIVCWTPIQIFVIINALVEIPKSTLLTITWHFCIALGYTNSSLNTGSLRLPGRELQAVLPGVLHAESVRAGDAELVPDRSHDPQAPAARNQQRQHGGAVQPAGQTAFLRSASRPDSPNKRSLSAGMTRPGGVVGGLAPLRQ